MKTLLTVVALGLISIGFVDCTKKSNTPPDPPEPKKYTITFDTQEGSEMDPITVTEGDTITKT